MRFVSPPYARALGAKPGVEVKEEEWESDCEW
jgi:hypothetical protein